MSGVQAVYLEFADGSETGKFRPGYSGASNPATCLPSVLEPVPMQTVNGPRAGLAVWAANPFEVVAAQFKCE